MINSQCWFGHLGTKESNLEVCHSHHTITQSIRNITVLEPLILILYLYIALSTGLGLHLWS